MPTQPPTQPQSVKPMPAGAGFARATSASLQPRSTEEWETLLAQVADAGGSDVCFVAGQLPLCHIQGAWVPPAGAEPVEPERLQGWAEDLASGREWRSLAAPEAPAIVRAWGGGARRLRATLRFHTRGLSIAVRLIPANLPSLADLQAPAILESLLASPGGLILFGGGAGSGRSTLLASALESINATESRRIVLLGRPIEFALTPRQSRIERLDLAEDNRPPAQIIAGLRYHSVDVVAIDAPLGAADLLEILDLAQSGVLVLLTISGASARSILQDLVDSVPRDRQAVARGILAESLRAIIVQALLSRADGKGLIPAHEILAQSRGLADPIREGRWDSLPKLISMSRPQGMRLFDEVLEEYARQNWITGSEAFQHAVEKARFLAYAPPDWRLGTE